MKQKISIILEAIVVTLVFLLASGSMVESYNQVFGWYKGVHNSYHDHHGYHGYRHYAHYGSRAIGHRSSGDHSRPGGPIGNQVNGSPGHRNYGKSGPISWHPKSPIFCHGNPVVCHPSTPITPVTPVISHPGGPNDAIISHPIIPVGRIGSGSAGGGNISPVTPVISHPGGGNISPVTPVISHPGGGIVDAGSPISPSSPGDPGGGGFPGGPVGIPSF